MRPSNPDDVSQADRDRMSAFWGDDSWREAAYEAELTLFGDRPRKLPNETIVEAFRQRLRTRAGFKYVPQPIPMRNGKNATLYYLFFAGPNPAGVRIAEDIFRRYRDRLS